ncbi:MAG: hypothetical protein IH614_16865 [Desulfuromonadales bacterium]|nr:hypothetical protein [Desulfuromonadales bacterium]
MATSNRDLRQEGICVILTQRAGSVPDASAVAEATTSTWCQIAALLTPVLGTRGVDVIFRRALYLTGKAFPWLASGEKGGDSAALLIRLKARLAGQSADTAAEAACALLVTFMELLTTLLGESLTEHLMGPVWTSPSPPSARGLER